MAQETTAQVDHVLELFAQFTELGQEPARSPQGDELFTTSRESVAESIRHIIDTHNLAALFREHIDKATFAGNTKETELPTRENLMGRVALTFLTDGDALVDDSEVGILPDILDDAVETVAQRLVGKKIAYQGKVLIIAKTHAQGSEENQKWIEDERPLFTERPVAAYSPRSRGRNVMLFLRASEPGSCVRIMNARDEEAGVNFMSSSQICEYLGLAADSTYNIIYDGHVMTLY